MGNWLRRKFEDKGVDAAQSAPQDEFAVMRERLIRENFCRAIHGSIFHTSAFYRYKYAKDDVPDYEYFLAQATNADNSLWNVMQVVMSEKPGESGEKLIKTRSATPVRADVPMFEAVEIMAAKEMERRAADAEAVPEYKLEVPLPGIYFRPFAEREGICFTVDGKPEPTLHGYSVMPGQYEGGADIEAQAAAEKAAQAAWDAALTDLARKNINTLDPLEIAVRTLEENARYHRIAEKFLQRLDDIKRPRDMSVGSPYTPAVIRARGGLLDDEINKLEYADLRFRLHKANCQLMIAELQREYIQVRKIDRRPAGQQEYYFDAYELLANLGKRLGYDIGQIMKLQANLLSDQAVCMDTTTEKFAGEYRRFLTRHDHWANTLRAQMSSPKAQADRVKELQDYLKVHHQRLTLQP